MTIQEALKNLNSLRMDKLIVLYYLDVVEKYIEVRKKINDLQGENIRLSRTGHEQSNSNIGYIRYNKNKERDLINKIPSALSLSDMAKTYKKMSNDELSATLSDEDRESVENYIERLSLKNKLPRVGQRFKFSFLPVMYEISDVEMDENRIYYKSESGSYSDSMSIDYFLKERNNNHIEYR